MTNILPGTMPDGLSGGDFYGMLMDGNLSETTTSEQLIATQKSQICRDVQLNMIRHRIIPSFYIVLCVVGVLGNGVVIKVLWSLMDKNNTRSVTDILVLNLAVADFIFVSSLPFWASNLFVKQRWDFGIVGCKLLSFITLLNLYGSVFFLVAMGIDRYLAVVFAVRARNYRTPANAKIFCLAIWIFAGLIGTEALAYRTVINENCFNKCVWQLPDGEGWNIAYFVVRVLFGFGFPFVVLVYCYVFIMIKLSKMARSSRVQGSVTSNQQKITRAILAVISLFVLCWLPNHIITIMIASTMDSPEIRKKLNIDTANLFSVCLAYANSSINPILYAFMKTEIREEGTRMLRNICSCFKGDDRKPPSEEIKAAYNFQTKPPFPRALQSKFSFFRHSATTSQTIIPAPETCTMPISLNHVIKVDNGPATASTPLQQSGEEKSAEENQPINLIVSAKI